MREDVYRVIKAFTARGDSMSSEVKRYAQYLVCTCQHIMQNFIYDEDFFPIVLLLLVFKALFICQVSNVIYSDRLKILSGMD